MFDHPLFQTLDFRLWSLPVAALLGAFLLLFSQRARPRTGCPLKALRGIGFQLDLNPGKQLADHAWSMAGSWQSVRSEQDRTIAVGKMTMARRTVHALVYSVKRAHRHVLRRVVIVSTPLPSSESAIFLSARDFDPSDTRAMKKRVRENPKAEFVRRWMMQGTTGPQRERIMSPGVMGLLLNSPRHVRIAIGSGMLSIAFEGSDDRREIEKIVQLAPALADLLEGQLLFEAGLIMGHETPANVHAASEMLDVPQATRAAA